MLGKPRRTASTSSFCRSGTRDAAVVLQGPDGRHHHDRIGPQAGHPALDVDELLRAEVRPEAGLGDHDVGELERGAGGDHRVAPVRDVGEGSAMHERRRVLEGLHEVGGQRVLEQHREGSLGAEVRGEHGLLGPVVGDHDAADPLLEVHQRLGQAEDRHQLRGHHDVEAVLARVAVGGAAEADHGLAQRPVVEVDDPLPGDRADVDVEGVAVVDVVVDERGEQVVGGRDGGEVAGEVQVDVGHRHHLGVAAAGRAALHPEDRAHGRLTQRRARPLADPAQRVGQPDGGRGLALAGRGRRDRGDQHQLAVGAVGQGCDVAQVDLGLVVAVGHQHRRVVDAERLARDVDDRVELGGVGDLSVGQHGSSSPAPASVPGRRDSTT